MATPVDCSIYSLNIDERTEQEKVAEAHRRARQLGYDGGHVILARPPVSVNTVVGGTSEKPRYWHGVPLDDLRELLADTITEPINNDNDGYEEARDDGSDDEYVYEDDDLVQQQEGKKVTAKNERHIPKRQNKLKP